MINIRSLESWQISPIYYYIIHWYYYFDTIDRSLTSSKYMSTCSTVLLLLLVEDFLPRPPPLSVPVMVARLEFKSGICPLTVDRQRKIRSAIRFTPDWRIHGTKTQFNQRGLSNENRVKSSYFLTSIARQNYAFIQSIHISGCSLRLRLASY